MIDWRKEIDSNILQYELLKRIDNTNAPYNAVTLACLRCKGYGN